MRPAAHQVSVLRSPAEARDAWLTLAGSVPVSPYQDLAWVTAWLETIGAAQRVKPAIILIADETGRPLGLLPLCVKNLGGVRCAAFAGGRDANGSMGLFDPAADWSAARLRQVLGAASRQAKMDMFIFANQRQGWGEQPNPLLRLGAQPSPSANHAADLPWTPERLSKHGRKKLRSKMSRLRSLGPVRFERARTPDEIAAVLDCHFAQKSARLREIGVPVASDLGPHRAFFERASASASGSPPSMEFYALRCGDTMVATFGGTGGPARFAGMVISHEGSEPYASCSPGDLLVAEVMAEKSRQGVASFDLGIGESRYKESFCPIVEPLFDVCVGTTVKGRVAAACWRRVSALKRRIKQSAAVWPRVQQLRRRVLALRPRSG